MLQKQTVITIIFIFLINSFGFAQSTNPDSYRDETLKIGEPMPNLVFDKIQYFETNQTSIEDLKGKPLILDFFSKNCTACFRKLPENNELYSEFKERVNIIMVGIDLNDDVQGVYETYRKKLNLNLPVTYDSIYYKKYGIRGVPHVIYINSEGIIKARTNFFDKQTLQRFIENKDFDYVDYSSEGKNEVIPFDPDKPFLVNGNGGNDDDFTYRSVFTTWKPGMENYVDYPFPFADDQPAPYNYNGSKKDYVQLLGRGLPEMYRMAYFGRSMNWHATDTVAYGNYHVSPILEIKDTSLFQAEYDKGINLFCYSQVLPPNRRTPENKMKVMQNDLQNMFGYEVSIETRMMPCLKLVATEKAKRKLKTKGGPVTKSTYNSLDGGSFYNIPITRLIDAIEGPLGLNYSHDLPLIDETGIKGNIDITLNAIINLEDIKKELRKSGLDIIEGEKEMKCIVIRDPKEE
ncbi:MAG TPA: redoxin domain-containing protein [Flavobacteriaceae bacterium]